MISVNIGVGVVQSERRYVVRIVNDHIGHVAFDAATNGLLSRTGTGNRRGAEAVAIEAIAETSRHGTRRHRAVRRRGHGRLRRRDVTNALNTNRALVIPRAAEVQRIITVIDRPVTNIAADVQGQVVIDLVIEAQLRRHTTLVGALGETADQRWRIIVPLVQTGRQFVGLLSLGRLTIVAGADTGTRHSPQYVIPARNGCQLCSRQ